MAALHIVNKADALPDCLPLLADGDALLLIEDGVYAVCADIDASTPCHALADDLEARGLMNRIVNAIEILSYDGFVELVERHQPVVTWSR